MVSTFVHVLHKPVLSPDEQLLALIGIDETIQLVQCSHENGGRPLSTIVRVPNSIKSFLRRTRIIRWSPRPVAQESLQSSSPSREISGLKYLLLSDGKRVIVLSADLSPSLSVSDHGETEVAGRVLADYDLGDQFGKLTYLEFAFDHQHAIVMFEHGINGIVLDLARPQRTEIPSLKFSDAKGVTQSPESVRFAVLRRERGQDKVSVLSLSPGKDVVSGSFDIQTMDAQGVMFCPSGMPMIAVWDSASYGVKVSFLTAQGQPLRQLDITSSHFGLVKQPLDIDGLGLTCWRWWNTNEATVQAVADGHKQVLVRSQVKASMILQTIAKFVHPDIIDGAETMIWQEIKAQDSSSSWKRESAAFSATNTAEATVPNDVEMIEINSDQSLIATKLKGFNKALWIWKPMQSLPASILLFKDPIRSVLWHPVLPNVLIIITNQNSPVLYAFCSLDLPPISGAIFSDSSSIYFDSRKATVASKYSGKWLSPSMSSDGRVPFLFSTDDKFDVGLLQKANGRVEFASILRHNVDNSDGLSFANETEEVEYDTPSRINKHSKSATLGSKAVMSRGLDVNETILAGSDMW